MKERAIRFNAEEVRAALSGKKTQVRIPVKPQPDRFWVLSSRKSFEQYDYLNKVPQKEGKSFHCPLGKPGDRLWVQETWALCSKDQKTAYMGEVGRVGSFTIQVPENTYLTYQADVDLGIGIWRPSIHMTRAFSRITLEITNVRVERVDEISEEDAKAEGIIKKEPERVTNNTQYGTDTCIYGRTPMQAFRYLWDSIYKKKDLGWDKSPWVWVIEFKKLEQEKL